MKYKIEGGQLPFVNIELAENETIVTEAGGMSWMSSNMRMSTKGDGIGKALGRLLTGESLFLNYYTALDGPGFISISTSLPGSIIPIEVTKDRPFIAQKGAFLGAESSVDVSIFFRKKLAAGLVGGEGFIMQKLSGNGIVFLEIDGFCVEKELAAGEELVVSTGHIAGMDETVSMDVRTVGGVKNAVFGGEGIFNTVLKGPGRVYLQTMPAFKLSRLKH